MIEQEGPSMLTTMLYLLKGKGASCLSFHLSALLSSSEMLTEELLYARHCAGSGGGTTPPLFLSASSQLDKEAAYSCEGWDRVVRGYPREHRGY